jgi:hypothetical protein
LKSHSRERIRAQLADDLIMRQIENYHLLSKLEKTTPGDELVYTTDYSGLTLAIDYNKKTRATNYELQ